MARILLFSQWRLWVNINYTSKSLDIYTDLTKKQNYDLNIHTFKACCLYALYRYKEAFEEANKGIDNDLNVPYINIGQS